MTINTFYELENEARFYLMESQTDLIWEWGLLGPLGYMEGIFHKLNDSNLQNSKILTKIGTKTKTNKDI